MAVTLRPAREADAEQVASLMTELGYPSTAGSVKDRLRASLNSQTSCCLVAQVDNEVIGSSCPRVIAAVVSARNL
jgi:predicted N-acetyltransferase YhbS